MKKKSILKFIILFAFSFSLDTVGQNVRSVEQVYNFLNKNYKLVQSSQMKIVKYFSDYKISDLPNQIRFIQIPNNSFVKNIELINPIYKKITNCIPEFLLKNNNNENNVESNLLPLEQVKFIGYITDDGKKTAVIKIYFHQYNLYKRTINELEKCKIRLTIGIKSSVANSAEDIQKRNSYNWIKFNQPYIKLAIGGNGIYRIKKSDIDNWMGGDQLIDPNKIRVFNWGKEIPVFVSSMTSFTDNDYVQFVAKLNYGENDYKMISQLGMDYNEYLNIYTDTSYYWLTWGNENGLRVSRKQSNIQNSQDTLSYHSVVKHYEKNERLWFNDAESQRQQLPFWQESKIWSWRHIREGVLSEQFSIYNIKPNSLLSAKVRVLSMASNINKDAHSTAIGIDSYSENPPIKYDYKKTINIDLSISSDSISNGQHFINVHNYKTQADVNQILIDWFDIKYETLNDLSNDSIIFKVDNLSGIKSRVIKFINAKDSNFVVYKNSTLVSSFIYDDNLKYILYEDSLKNDDEIVIIHNSKIQKPQFIYSKVFSDFTDNIYSAEHLIISNRILMNSVSEYSNFINQSYNLKSKAFYVDDLFDLFNYGYPEPYGIKAFIESVKSSWTNKIKFLFLIGDANYDYKNFTIPAPPEIKNNLVPSFGFPVSDNWYTMFDTLKTSLPEIAVGRLPAKNNEEVRRYLLKHQKYLARKYDDWNKSFLLFSGGSSKNLSETEQIKNISNSIVNTTINRFPIYGNSTHFYKTNSPVSNFGPFSQEFIDAKINESGLFISYIGHSGTQTWDNGVTDVTQLASDDDTKLNLITDFGCSTGKFAEPNINSFGNLAICKEENGSSIAYVANSSLGYTSTSFSFPQIFYEKLLTDTLINIGQLHLEAKRELFERYGITESNRVFVYCNHLFGDPIINIKLPQKPNLTFEPSKILSKKEIITDNDRTIDLQIAIKNNGNYSDKTIQLYIEDKVNNVISFSDTIAVEQPKNMEILDYEIPIKNQTGTHNISFSLDDENVINEIHEDDNYYSFDVFVYSSNYQFLTKDDYYNSYPDSIKILKPIIVGNNSLVELQVSQTSNFTEHTTTYINFDSKYKIVKMPIAEPGKRYWARIYDPSFNSYSKVVSFIKSPQIYDWYFNASSFNNNIKLHNVEFDSTSSSIKLANKTNHILIRSGSFYEGSIASILFNGTEYLPTTFFWGIASAELDPITFEPKNVKYFTYPSSVSADSLINYINRIPDGTILALTICDDGAQSVLGFSTSTPVRDAIKLLGGSTFIDSVLYRESWCMIGIKGADPGSSKEVYTHHFEGQAILTDSINTKYNTGKITFPSISLLPNIDSIFVNSVNESETFWYYNNKQIEDSIKIGSKNFYDLNIDDIDTINSEIHFNKPALGYNINKIKEIGLFSKGLPEILLSADTINSKDSLEQGELFSTRFQIWNVGRANVDSVSVLLSLSDENYLIRNDSVTFKNIRQNEFLSYEMDYDNESLKGDINLEITADHSNRIKEFFEDNNILKINKYIRIDSTSPKTNVIFNGIEIFDGEYISSKPKIEIQIFDEDSLTLNDTSFVDIFLNKQRIYISDPNIKAIEYNFTNPKIKIIYEPQLKSGTHTLEVFSKDLNNNQGEDSKYTRTFKVDEEAKILEVYNYPNPMKGDTYFTFRLTQIPNNLSIKIFTIAGRLIKSLEIPTSVLRHDINRIYWDGTDNEKQSVANGVYFYKIIYNSDSKNISVTNKLAIVK